MSLINQMLQDIEKRQIEVGGAQQLPSWVPAAVPAKKPKKWLLGFLALALGALLSAGWFFGSRHVSPTPTTDVVLVPTATEAAAVKPGPLPVEPQAALPPPPKSLRKAETASAQPKAAKPEPKHVAASPAPSKNLKGVDNVDNISPDNQPHQRAEQHYQNAVAAYGQGRTTESLTQARTSLASDPGHLGARQLLLRQLLEQGDKAQALTVLREGLHLHPEQVSWSILLVRLELGRGDLPAARLAVEQASPQASGSADFQSLNGALAQRQGRPDEAADHYRSALRIKPGEGRNWVGLGLALEAQGHAPEAREAFRRAVSSEGLSADLQALAQQKLR